jgi:hypothetical protein
MARHLVGGLAAILVLVFSGFLCPAIANAGNSECYPGDPNLKFLKLRAGELFFSYTRGIPYPNPEELYVTLGDGNIERPYQPLGEIVVKKRGLGFFGIPIIKPDLERVIKETLLTKAKDMGGDGVINLCVADLGVTPIYQMHLLAAALILPGFVSFPKAEVVGTVIKR